MRRKAKIVVTVSAASPRNAAFIVRRYYALPAEQVTQEAIGTMRLQLARQLDLSSEQVAASTAPQRAKPSYRWRGKQPDRSNEAWRDQALKYVKWLAARDGVDLPKSGEIRADWSGVYSTTRRSGPGGFIFERRIRAVQWGHYEARYNTRKDGRRGAYLYTDFVPDFTFELPHWDWAPSAPVEETLPA